MTNEERCARGRARIGPSTHPAPPKVFPQIGEHDAPDEGGTYELTFTQTEGAKKQEVQELFTSRLAAEQAMAYIKSRNENTYGFTVRPFGVMPKTFEEWYKEMSKC